jgi:hypothetical protein
MVNIFKGEPIATIVGGVYAVIQAGLMLAISFGLHLTAPQVIALNTFVLAVLVFLARGQVSPKDIIANAKAVTDVGAPTPPGSGG